MLSDLPPRSFNDITVPVREDGTALDCCAREGDYEVYVKWLSDYLHCQPIPLSPAQELWLAESGRTPDYVIFQCSDELGYFIGELEMVEDSILSGETWEEWLSHMMSVWQEIEGEDRDEFDDWLGMTEATYQRIGAELQERCAVGAIPEHADIPFRPLLAWALRQVDDAQERYREIDWFFLNLWENLSK